MEIITIIVLQMTVERFKVSSQQLQLAFHGTFDRSFHDRV